MKFISTTGFLLLCSAVSMVHAQTATDNIVIESKTETYSYKISGSEVILEERSKTDYRCLKWPETIPVAEFYDIYSEVRNVSVKAGTKISPTYEMYQENGIFYNDTKVCYFNLPFTKKEETATVSFEKVYNEVRLFYNIPLFEPQHVGRKTVEIVVPAWMHVDITGHNLGTNIEKNVTTDPKSGTVTHTYTVRDQTGIKWQTEAPGFYKTAPFLILIPRSASLKKEEITFFRSYDDVYRWCREKADMTFNDEAPIAALTQQITAGCGTEDEKITEIFAWVQDNIRYLAFSYGFAGWIPDHAHDVMLKKYGDCKGMSNLLKAMLRSAGFDARLVWIGTRHIYSDPEVSLPLFNHMICALLRNGTITYLDPTVKYMVAGEYHEAIQGRATMIENGAEYILGRVPQLPPSQNTDSLHCTYRIDGNMLVGNVNMILSGESKQDILTQIYALESSRRTNMLKQFLEKARPQDKVSEISIDGVDSKENTLRLSYKEIRNSSLNRIGAEMYVDMDTRQDFALAAVDTVKRKADMEFPYRELTIREEYLEIPAGYRVASLPSDLDMENRNCRISASYRIEEGKVKYRKEIEITNTWLRKEDFKRWNDDIATLNKNYRNQIVLKKY